jgi:hypothetical protein
LRLIVQSLFHNEIDGSIHQPFLSFKKVQRISFGEHLDKRKCEGAVVKQEQEVDVKNITKDFS